MWRDLWVRLDTGTGRRGPTCSIWNTHHMAGLQGAVGTYQYADSCRFSEHESTPFSCRVMRRFHEKSAHVAKTHEKIQNLSGWGVLVLSHCGICITGTSMHAAAWFSFPNPFDSFPGVLHCTVVRSVSSWSLLSGSMSAPCVSNS